MPSTNRSSLSARHRVHTVTMIGLIMIVGVFCIGGYLYRDELGRLLSGVKTYTILATHWILPHQKKIAPKVAALKEAIENEPPIHFEFYTTLPKIAMVTRETQAIEKKNKNTSLVIANADQLMKDLTQKIDETKSAMKSRQK